MRKGRKTMCLVVGCFVMSSFLSSVQPLAPTKVTFIEEKEMKLLRGGAGADWYCPGGNVLTCANPNCYGSANKWKDEPIGYDKCLDGATSGECFDNATWVCADTYKYDEPGCTGDRQLMASKGATGCGGARGW